MIDTNRLCALCGGPANPDFIAVTTMATERGLK